MASLKIQLLGEFRVWRGENPIERKEWGRQKTRSLLKLLLTRTRRTFSRDEILEALWPDTPPATAEQSLRVAVSLLRKALEPDLKHGSDSRYVLRRSPGYLFDPQEECQVDAWEFEEHHDRAQRASQERNLEEAIREYRAALELVGGEFLAEDPYEEWTIEARQEWQDRYLIALSDLSECLAQKGRYTQAIEVCERALNLDKYREDLHRRLMLYQYCSGEQALALQAYRRYARNLEKELKADPSPELARLEEQIKARHVPGVDEARRRYPRPRRPLRFPYSLSRTHFVGRDKEYGLLAGRLEEVMVGSGGAVAVEGESGIGKTRLVEEFLGFARSRGVRVLTGRCYERELGPPLEPITDALGPLPVTDGMVARSVQAGASEPVYPWEAGAYDEARIYHALTGKLIQPSRTNDHEALILFVDDIQWADPATLGFLSYVAKRILDERVLLMVSYRREDAVGLSGWLDHLAERRVIDTLSLTRLSLKNTKELLGRMSSRSFEELTALANFLYKESEGNPFYVVEYLRWLIESGAVQVDTRRRICGLKSELLRESALPFGVRALIQARLSSLDEEARDLLQLTATIGRTFNLELLCEVAARGEAAIFRILEPLMASGLVVKSSPGSYQFSHDKLRQALYEGIRDPERRVLHLRVARVLEERGGEPAELAHHYLRASAWRPALRNLLLAARKAEKGTAWDSALEYYARALEVVERFPGSSDEERFELLAARARILEVRIEDRIERSETVQEMSELAKSLGDRPRIAEAYIRRAGTLGAFSDLEGSSEAGREAVSIFRELGDKAGEARAYREVGHACWRNEDYAGALEANFRALRIHREIGNRRGEAGDIGNIAQVYRSMGNYEQALCWAEEAIRIYQELGDKIGEALMTQIVAGIHRYQGDSEAALPLYLEVLKSAAEIGKTWLLSNHSACGAVYLDLRAPKKALEHFRTALRLSREIGHINSEGNALMGVGVSLELVGDLSGAEDAYRRAIKLLDTAYEVYEVPEELSGKADALTLLAGLLHHSLDEPEDALESYEAAARIYRKLGDTQRLRKALLGLGGLRWRVGSVEGSAHTYEEVLQLAKEQGERAHQATALASLSVVYRDLGRLKEALSCARGALGLLRELGDLQAEAYVLSSMAQSYTRLGHHPSALSCLRRSLRLRKRIEDKEGEVRVLYELAKIYETMGDAYRARAYFEEAASKEGVEGEIVPSGERRS